MTAERDDTPVLITEAAPSYEEEYAARKRKYITMMLLRLPCLVLAEHLWRVLSACLDHVQPVDHPVRLGRLDRGPEHRAGRVEHGDLVAERGEPDGLDPVAARDVEHSLGPGREVA